MANLGNCFVYFNVTSSPGLIIVNFTVFLNPHSNWVHTLLAVTPFLCVAHRQVFYCWPSPLYSVAQSGTLCPAHLAEVTETTFLQDSSLRARGQVITQDPCWVQGSRCSGQWWCGRDPLWVPVIISGTSFVEGGSSVMWVPMLGGWQRHCVDFALFRPMSLLSECWGS